MGIEDKVLVVGHDGVGRQGVLTRRQCFFGLFTPRVVGILIHTEVEMLIKTVRSDRKIFAW